VFGPVGRRRFWWYTYRCKVCGAHLFGRARSLDDVADERRAGCGHRVQVMAARIYTQPEPEAAA
jgi:predicted SprT family Zn-dependent metalloprotease